MINGVQGYLTHDEGYALYKLASTCRGTQVLEIGSLQGLSSISLALSGKQVLSIDLWDGSDISDGNRHINCDLSTYIKNLTIRELYNFVPYKMSSRQASNILSDISNVGLLFIDGSHSYDDITNDIYNWSCKLVPDTWLLFHDYTNSSIVKQAVDEWIKDNSICTKEQFSIGSLISFLI